MLINKSHIIVSNANGIISKNDMRYPIYINRLTILLNLIIKYQNEIPLILTKNKVKLNIDILSSFDNIILGYNKVMIGHYFHGIVLVYKADGSDNPIYEETIDPDNGLAK